MTDSFDHCEALVRAADKDRFLATLFAPARYRRALFALYAFNIEVARVPLSYAARQAVASDPALMETALTGGDDYEVVATVPAPAIDALMTQATAAGVALTEIGIVRADGPQVRFLDPAGKPLLFKRPSFSHF